MLLLIGAIGLLMTIQRCRLPGIPFFSFITVLNRKQKLTAAGSRAYLAFFVVLAAGIVLRLAAGPGSPAPAAAPEAQAASAAGVPAGHAAAIARSRQDIVEQMVLSRKAIFSVLLTAPEMARVREQLDVCEDRFREGAEKGPDNGIMENAVKFCMRTAAQLCHSWPDPDRNFEPSLACAGLRRAEPGLWYGLN
jgi:hypothetical protein